MRERVYLGYHGSSLYISLGCMCNRKRLLHPRPELMLSLERGGNRHASKTTLWSKINRNVELGYQIRVDRTVLNNLIGIGGFEGAGGSMLLLAARRRW